MWPSNSFETHNLSCEFTDKTKHLYEVSRAPETAWPLLCDAIQSGALTTVDDVSKAVARVKAIEAARPEWWAQDTSFFVALCISEP